MVSRRPAHTPADVTPEGYNARSMVHEYGGGAYTVHHGAVFFSNMPDATALPAGSGPAPVPITPDTDATQRFADGQVTPDGRWWIGVRERHDLGPTMRDVVNELVAVPTDGSAAPRTIVGRPRLLSRPRGSPRTGRRLAWLTWDLPWMPWDGTELFVATSSADASSVSASAVAGRARRGVDLAPGVEPDGRPRVRVATAAAGGTSSGSATARVPLCTRPRRSSAGHSGASGEHSIAFLRRRSDRVSLRRATACSTRRSSIPRRGSWSTSICR